MGRQWSEAHASNCKAEVAAREQASSPGHHAKAEDVGRQGRALLRRHFRRRVKGRAGAKVGHVRGLLAQAGGEAKVLRNVEESHEETGEQRSAAKSGSESRPSKSTHRQLGEEPPHLVLIQLEQDVAGRQVCTNGEGARGEEVFTDDVRSHQQRLQPWRGRTSVDDALAVQVLEAQGDLVKHVAHGGLRSRSR